MAINERQNLGAVRFRNGREGGGGWVVGGVAVPEGEEVDAVVGAGDACLRFCVIRGRGAAEGVGFVEEVGEDFRWRVGFVSGGGGGR